MANVLPLLEGRCRRSAFTALLYRRDLTRRSVKTERRNETYSITRPTMLKLLQFLFSAVMNVNLRPSLNLSWEVSRQV